MKSKAKKHRHNMAKPSEHMAHTTDTKATIQTSRDKLSGSRSDTMSRTGKIWFYTSIFMTIMFFVLVMSKDSICNGKGMTECPAIILTGAATETMTDEFIYLYSDACTTICDEIEPVAKDLAEKSKMAFRKIKYPQPIEAPGFMLLLESESTIPSVIEDTNSLKILMCEYTNNAEICNEAESAKTEQEKAVIEAEKKELESIPKSEKPKVELYVMSFCPYGNMAENTMLPVYELLKDKVEWDIHYIVAVQDDTVRSLHGQPEVDQNIREVCVKRDYGMDAFWSFVTYVNNNCGSDGSCWEAAAEAAGADADKIQECFDDDGLELMKAEAEATNKAGASGSPTMLVNSQRSNYVYKYSQPDYYKKAICAGFSTEPSVCSNVISTTASTAPQGGSC
ncbi:hypothetical protein JXB31_04430 [Candidatus Woesearchaeota archaeon]|nr:hypothetical protein [Candidatus Woesearchaeota archaeon]